MINEKEPLKDWQKALLVIHLYSKGLPEWLESHSTATLLSLLLDWDERRANNAISIVSERGLIYRIGKEEGPNEETIIG